MPAASASADREIVTTRLLDAPRDLVFELWTSPQHIARWWGPTGFTTTTSVMDVRPGGVWRFVMHGPDGRDYQNKIVFIDVLRPERLVYRHVGEGDTADIGFHTTVTFDDEDGRTRLTMRAVFETAEACRRVIDEYGAVEGGRQTLARLDEYATEQVAAALDVVSERIFDAPRALVFQAWTDPAHLSAWWGPKDFTNTFHEFDLRPGGNWRFIMHGPDGRDYPNHSIFREIVVPERLVFDHVSGHRFRVTATFEDLGAATRVVWRMRFESAAELAAVRPHVVAGNQQNLDKLAARLAAMT